MIEDTETVVLNLKVEELKVEDLIKISEVAEKAVRRYITRRIGGRFVEDLVVTVSTRIEGSRLTITIDVSFAAPKVLGLDYEGIIDSACDEAFKAVEEVLKRYAKDSSVEVEESST